jgi:hypothetical protein
MLDALVFSSVWVASAAGALALACSLAMGIPAANPAVGLAFAGTLVVYNVDRLRDVERDRTTTPRRSEFIDHHGGGLALLAVGAGLASFAFAWSAGPRVWLLLAPVLLLGLFHRRIKHLTFGKSGYITAAWVAVVVVVPAAIGPDATAIGWAAAFTASAVLANSIACDIRDREVAAALLGERRALLVARACAAGGCLLGFFAPASARSLVALPLATLLVLLPFRPSERYGLVAVDGALLAGALVAAVW